MNTPSSHYANNAFLAALLLVLIASTSSFGFAPKHEFYQLKIYHVKDDSQRGRLEYYLQQAYLPALHRAGIAKVGVFKADAPADSVVYVLIPFKSVEQFIDMPSRLAKDNQYAASGQDYLNAEFNNPTYKNFESILMEAFSGMPSLVAPKLNAGLTERVYELRRYEAATEKLHENKISQFNNGELDIFKRLGFNTIFCGQVRAGGKLPSLMYMTSFENKTERDAHWKAFSADPGWKEFNAKPEYAHNFLRADIYLVHPTAYSEI